VVLSRVRRLSDLYITGPSLTLDILNATKGSEAMEKVEVEISKLCTLADSTALSMLES
jgi:hypothetical protein